MIEDNISNDEIIEVIKLGIYKIISYKKKRKEIIGLIKYSIIDYLNSLKYYNLILDYNINNIIFVGYKKIHVQVSYFKTYDDYLFKKRTKINEICRLGITTKMEQSIFINKSIYIAIRDKLQKENPNICVEPFPLNF